jgi:hypothetical protein
MPLKLVALDPFSSFKSHLVVFDGELVIEWFQSSITVINHDTSTFFFPKSIIF